MNDDEQRAINAKVPKALYIKLKVKAAQDGKQLRAVLIEAITNYLKNNK